MLWEGWLTIAVVVLLIVGLASNWVGADLIVLACLAILVVVGEVTGSKHLLSAKAAVAEFGNAGLVTVALLFVVVAGLVQTGAMSLITQPLIGRPRTVPKAQLRILLPVVGLSAFLNNTPVVAMFMPIVDDICKKTGISPSKLFLPMAYAATFGGCCTLIGTSTNLVVNGLLIQNQLRPFAMFDLTWIGLPSAVAAIVYLLSVSPWLLPDRRPPISLGDDPRQYTVEMIVQPGGALVGRTIEEAGLRHLPGLYLVEIERAGNILPAVGPRERLHAEDRLVFVGIVESVVDLQKIRGLAPATDHVFALNTPKTDRSLIEAVVSNRCPLIGTSIRAGQFRSKYNAAVIAAARGAQRIRGKIGDIVLEPGDTLLLEAHSDFAQQQRNSNDFFLVSRVENSTPPRYERAGVALGILVALVVVSTIGVLDILTASMMAAVLMIVTRCCTGGEARQSIDWSVLVVIGASLGIGQTMKTSGAADVIAQSLIGLASGNTWLVLAMVYFVTMVFTEILTNNAAAVLVFPISLATARTLGVDFMPFAVVITVAASAGYATPIGYQTNLMVYGPGGYRYSDYLRLGIPLNLLYMTITVLITPFVFPFQPVP